MGEWYVPQKQDTLVKENVKNNHLNTEVPLFYT